MTRPGTIITPLGDPLNTTTDTLAEVETYTGTFEQSNFPDVMVSVHTSHTGVLFMDYSDDNVYFNTYPKFGIPVIGGTHLVETAFKGPRFFRARFKNGSEAQTSMRLYTYYGSFTNTADIDDSITIADSTDGRKRVNLVTSKEDKSDNAIVVHPDVSNAEVLNDIRNQLALLNTRFEEAFRTGLTMKDKNDGSY